MPWHYVIFAAVIIMLLAKRERNRRRSGDLALVGVLLAVAWILFAPK